MSKLFPSLLGSPDNVQPKRASKREKAMVKTGRKGRGNIDTAEGETQKGICSAAEKASYKVVVNSKFVWGWRTYAEIYCASAKVGIGGGPFFSLWSLSSSSPPWRDGEN